MPYDAIPVLSSDRLSPYTSDPAVAGVNGPMLGSTVTITGEHFANSPFFGVAMQTLDSSDDIWTSLEYTYVDHKTLYVEMPEMEYLGTSLDVVIRVTNGGTVYPAITYQTIGFTYDYTLGEDWVDDLVGFYTFDAKSWDSVAMTWDNLVNRSDTDSKVAKVANYGAGGPFLAAGRDAISDMGLTFAVGERIEMSPLAPSWSACLWLYVKEGSDVIFYELDSTGHTTVNSLA
eukprot:scaffold33010_cov46-Prasinocladus_malaysianus.AAC.1